MLGFDVEFPALHAIHKFRLFLKKKLQEISSKSFQRKLGNCKKSREKLGFDGKFPAVSTIAKLPGFLIKNLKKSALKYLTGN